MKIWKQILDNFQTKSHKLPMSFSSNTVLRYFIKINYYTLNVIYKKIF